MLAVFVVVPTSQRSAEQLASLMILSTEALQTARPQQRALLRQHLFDSYGLNTSAPPRDLFPRQRHLHYFLLLEEALSQRLGESVTIMQSDLDGLQDNYWVRLSGGLEAHYVGFVFRHKWLDLPLIILIIIVVGFVATVITSMTLARRLTQPLKHLVSATRLLASGEKIEALPESGPLEMVELVSSFNSMSQQIYDLVANRTTLLAGISHDLRSPLARMELSVVMLGDEADPYLVKQLRRDITQMNRLIGAFIEVSRGLQEGEREWVEIPALLSEVATEFKSAGANLKWVAGVPCRAKIHSLALRRIVINFIENALRYSNQEEVVLQYHVEVRKGKTDISIEVLDNGPGIPEHELDAVFRPFYRLEQSRSSNTGGCGLGLSVVRQLADANGYRVELLAREGGGIRARISLVPRVLDRTRLEG